MHAVTYPYIMTNSKLYYRHVFNSKIHAIKRFDEREKRGRNLEGKVDGSQIRSPRRRRKGNRRRLSSDFHWSCSWNEQWTAKGRLGAASLGRRVNFPWWIGGRPEGPRQQRGRRGFFFHSACIAADGKLKVSRKCIACRLLRVSRGSRGDTERCVLGTLSSWNS